MNISTDKIKQVADKHQISYDVLSEICEDLGLVETN